MKEKKAKSLVDLKNFRSTRLKQLTFGAKSLGATSTSISTTSNSVLPPNLYIVNDSINICNMMGEYRTNRVDVLSGSAYPITYYPSINFFSIGNDGWYCYSVYKNWSDIVGDVTGVTGYLFLFFNNKYNAGICSNCYRSVYNKPSLCVTMDTNQGAIFAVVISSIAQINALNLTYAYQSDKKFLSAAIKSTIDGNSSLKNVITQIKESTGETTPILTYNPVHPLLGENVTNFSCVQNASFNILENFIFIISFSANSNFLSQSDVMKLPFSVKDISGSGVAELGNNNTTIKFLSSGTCTIYYQIEPFNDVENIFKDPNGPSFYEVKGFSLQINVFSFND